LPADWIAVLKAPGRTDPHRLIFPLYPDNDEGDSKKPVDGACIMDHHSVKARYKQITDQTIFEVSST